MKTIVMTGLLLAPLAAAAQDWTAGKAEIAREQVAKQKRGLLSELYKRLWSLEDKRDALVRDSAQREAAIALGVRFIREETDKGRRFSVTYIPDPQSLTDAELVELFARNERIGRPAYPIISINGSIWTAAATQLKVGELAVGLETNKALLVDLEAAIKRTKAEIERRSK